MADLQTTIDLIFRGVDEVSDVTEKVAGSLSDLSDAASDIAEPFADLADKVAVVQAALLAVAGVIGTLAYKESVEFESSLLDLQKQMDETEGSARGVSAGIEELGVKYGTNANELVKSVADFRAASYDLDTSTKLVEQSLKLVIAGGVSTEAAVSIMNRTLAGFGIESQDVVREAEHLGDTLNKTADLTKSSFTELAAGFSDLSPIAKLTGFSFEETAALLTKVIDVFGSGSEAANGLKSGFLSLVAPSKESAAAMEELGVRFDASGKPIGTVKDILATLAPEFNKLDESQKLSAAAMIFGKEQAGKLVAVLGNYSDAMVLAGTVTQSAAGSIQAEVELRLQAAEAQINSTNEAWRQFLRALGDQFQVNTTGVISSLGDIAIAFKKTVDGGGLGPLFDLLNPQLKALEETLRTVAKNLPAAFEGLDFSGLVKSLENLGAEGKNALEALFGPIDLSSVDGLKDAIQNVIDTLTSLTNLTAGELGGLAPFLAGIRQMALAFKDAAPESQNLIGSLLGIGSGVQAATGLLEPLNTALLGVIALGGKFAPVAAEIGAFGAAMIGPQGLAVAFGVAASELIKFLVPADQLLDYSWPDWVAGQQGATIGTALYDIGDGFKALAGDVQKWLDIAPGATDQQKAINDAFLKKIPVDSFDGAIAAIQRFEAELQQNQDEHDHYFDWIKTPLPALQTDGALSKMDELAEKGRNLGKALEEAIVGGNQGGYKVEFTADGIPKITADAQSLKNSFEALDGTVKTTADGFKYVEETAANGQKTFRQLGPSFVEASKEATALEKAQRALGDAFGQGGTDVGKITGALNEYMSALGQSGKLTTDQFIELTKVTSDFKAKMEEIASNERIKNLEFTASIITTKLETDAERVKATFASIDTTINSTGELLGNLFGNLNDAGSRWDKLRIEDQIEKENERRQEALDLQKKLAEAEIDRIKAQTESLNRGDSLIQIDGKGLQPELEAFMWKILGAIRTRANAEFSDYLLGLGVA